MADATYHFPPDFIWGTATSSHQVEGHNAQNDWWQWEQEGGGRVYNDDTSGAACDWWNGQAEEDINRMAELNTRAHRLSLEWSRIEPTPGKWDHDAIDRYRALLLRMRDAGIQPMVTLHHFTNPIWFAEQGGWLNPEAPSIFTRFAAKVSAEMADLCTVWCTINEPNVYAAQSYYIGKWPPGQKDLQAYYQVVLNMLKGHAGAYVEIHQVQPQAQVGLAKHMVAWHPRAAGNLVDMAMAWVLDRTFNGVTLDALSQGSWAPIFSRKLSVPGLRSTLDWIGLNYYQRYDAWFAIAALRKSFGVSYAARPGAPKGPEGWGELYPEGLLAHIKRLFKALKVPIYITENGVPDQHDTLRPAYMLSHLKQVWKAIMHMYPVNGYFWWSLLDNFEWGEGYDPRFRFGLYGVDFETQERTLRDSGRLYAEIAQSNTISSDQARRYAPESFDSLFPGTAPDK